MDRDSSMMSRLINKILRDYFIAFSLWFQVLAVLSMSHSQLQWAKKLNQWNWGRGSDCANCNISNKHWVLAQSLHQTQTRRNVRGLQLRKSMKRVQHTTHAAASQSSSYCEAASHWTPCPQDIQWRHGIWCYSWHPAGKQSWVSEHMGPALMIVQQMTS